MSCELDDANLVVPMVGWSHTGICSRLQPYSAKLKAAAIRSAAELTVNRQLTTGYLPLITPADRTVGAFYRARYNQSSPVSISKTPLGDATGR